MIAVVIAVPMLAPSARAIPAGRANRPSLAIAIAIPTVAAEDCTIAVKTAPATMPANGFSNPLRIARNGS